MRSAPRLVNLQKRPGTEPSLPMMSLRQIGCPHSELGMRKSGREQEKRFDEEGRRAGIGRIFEGGGEVFVGGWGGIGAMGGRLGRRGVGGEVWRLFVGLGGGWWLEGGTGVGGLGVAQFFVNAMANSMGFSPPAFHILWRFIHSLTLGLLKSNVSVSARNEARSSAVSVGGGLEGLPFLSCWS